MKKGLFAACVLFASLYSTTGSAQWYHDKYMGARLGIVLAVGTHVDRIGICANGYYFDNWFQGNAEVRAYYNFKDLGPKQKHIELVCALGFALGYGKTDTIYNRFYSSVSNQTKYRNSFGYSYNMYFNRIHTTQQSGIIAFQFYGFSLISENDILGRQRLDRFRTGAVQAQYQYQEFQFAINSTLWTGQLGNKIMGDPHFSNGYMDTTNGVYTNFSHGIISLQCQTTLPYYQYAQGNLGLDADQIRNALQNKLVHKLFKAHNAYMPMLDTKGDQYLYKDGQQIRKGKFYFNLYLDPNVFY